MIDGVEPIPVTRPSPFLKVYDFKTNNYIWINLDMICSIEMLTDSSICIRLANAETIFVDMTEDEAKLHLMGIHLDETNE